MKNDYFLHYFLSYFDLKRTTNISQIVHVFHAKRTPSMFYRIEKNGWHHGFGFNPRIQKEQLEKLVKIFMQNGWLSEQEKGYKLTEAGQEICINFFNEHYYPKRVNTFSNATIRNSFWNRIQLFVQVFSEMSYQHKEYVPVIKHPHHQENVRHLFQQFGKNKTGLLNQWVKEQTYLFNQLDTQRADVLASLLTGHEQIGKTKDQTRKYLEMSSLEFHFYFNDAIEVFIKTIKLNRKKVPLIFAILKHVMHERNQGLSLSTNQTYKLLENGYTIEQVANRRAIKENTVKEHILEMAFVFEDFPYQAFVPPIIYKDLNNAFDKKKNYTYKEATVDFGTVEFMYFRLVELERMRRHAEAS